MFSTIREFLAGKKTYITAVIALATAVVAWAEGGLTNEALVVAVFAALQTIFIRAGVSKVAGDTIRIADEEGR